MNLLKKPVSLFSCVFLLLICVYLLFDFIGPSEIPLKPSTAFGFSCLRAKDLVVQEYDQNDNLWATRGMIIYEQKKDDNKFIRIAHTPTGFSIFWLRNFSIIRKLTIRPECVEMVVTDKGDICALSAGKMWILNTGAKKFKETLILSNYGFGDQGIRNDGIINIDDSTIVFGEYFKNPYLGKVRIFKSRNNMSSWNVAYEFQPGQIRHIHSVQRDPYTGKLWVCTGDDDAQPMIAYSEDKFKTIKKIGQGSQLWRVCQLVFTEEDVLWGTDTPSEDVAGIYRLNKNNGVIEKLQKINGAVFFGTRLANGTIVMSTDREGTKGELDNWTRLLVLTKDNKITSFDCGTWNHNTKGFWFKFAMLRFQRNQGAPSLAITILNQKEFSDGELVIISEDNLIVATKLKSSKGT